MRDTLLLLYAMALENDSVQDYLFEHINILVNVKYAINDLAEVLKEVSKVICYNYKHKVTKSSHNLMNCVEPISSQLYWRIYTL